MGGARAAALRVLFVAVAVCWLDQDLLAPNMSACAADLGLSALEKDEKLGGAIAAGLFLSGAPASFVVGALADAGASRRRLMTWVLLIGATGSAASALCSTFAQLWVARALTGVSLGGVLPLTFSVLGDIVEPSALTAMSGRIGLVMTSSSVAGQALAGRLGPSLGWRAPFAIVGIGIYAAAFLVSRAMAEPPRRQGRAGTSGGGARAATAWRGLLRVPTVWLVYLQGLPGCLPWGVIKTFLPDYLHVEGRLSVRAATMLTGVWAVGCTAGQLIGGEGGQALYNRRAPTLETADRTARDCALPAQVRSTRVRAADAHDGHGRCRADVAPRRAHAALLHVCAAAARRRRLRRDHRPGDPRRAEQRDHNGAARRRLRRVRAR